MNNCKVFAVIFCWVLSCAVLLPAARADAWNQKTKMIFAQPVELPGGVLPAGTYWFLLLDNHYDRNIVQVFSEDWSYLYATLSTIPTDRQQATDETEIKFAERPYDKPEALLKWYYPGLLTGHEFLYSRKQQKELAHDGRQDVLVVTVPL
jgi:hypothetical protein